jgi:thiol-disulfide isomerase/thioredoxin
MSFDSPVRALTLSLVFLILPVVATAQMSVAEPPEFPERRSLELVTPRLTDRELTQRLATLDALLRRSDVPGGTSAPLTYWNFVKSLQAAVLSPAQEERARTHLAGIARTRPEQAALTETASSMLARLTVGKQAPEIFGKDLDGADFRLSDYRGRVVLLVFGSEWCAICRTQYPYERLLQDLYGSWPFSIVGVDTGSSRQAVKRARVSVGLPYRAWWDGTTDDAPLGPIATEWNARGFPTVYLLDGYGVIRFVDLRNEDLIKGVRQLLEEQVELQARR